MTDGTVLTLCSARTGLLDTVTRRAIGDIGGAGDTRSGHVGVGADSNARVTEGQRDRDVATSPIESWIAVTLARNKTVALT